MVKKIIFAFLLFPLFLFSQTFTNSLVEPAGSWNTSLTKTITVSGLPNLQNGVFELNQVNLHLGDDANTRNYFSYRIVLQKGALVIELVATNGLPNSIIRQIDTKFRYNNVLKRLFEHGGTTQPFHIGYYRSQDDFSAFNGIDPNGDWTITITESSGSSGGKFNKIDLVFGVPLSINSQISTTTYDSCSTTLCVSSNEITIATNDGFTPQVSDMFNGNTTGCSWNAAQNNSSWFRFTATQASAKITISGISGNIQILGISPGSDNNICTPADNVVITGGCPDDVLNDSYFSPQYINGSTRNNQLNLSGLVTGQEYYFIVDGTGGAISPFYIEMEGANQSCNCFVDTPVVNTTPASCSSNSISTIINYDALLNYTFSPVGPTIGVGGFISNMNTGVNYTLIASNGSCSSTSSASFSNFDQLLVQPEPTINSVAASCSSAGSSTISNYDASNTYTFTPVGPTIGAAGVISGMTVGISYTVTATNGSCTSLASISFSNAAQLSTPTVPTITSVAANCSSAGSSTISNYDASNTYTFTPAGPIVGAGGVISVMTIGTSYTVTATNGGCTSSASSSFSNTAQLSTPAVPTITSVAASCLSAGSSTISNYDVSNTYTFTPAGPIVGAAGVISSMTIGTSYTVIAANGGCSSLASVNFSNSAQLPPLQGTISGTNNSTCSVSPICVPTGTNVVINEVMHWPSGGQGLIGTGREYIELYNPTCSPIDISCFIIGTRSAPDSNPTGPLQTGGSIIIPSGTILQPKSHYVIGTSSTSSNLLSVDFKTDLNLSNYCSTGNFVMPNGDGWLALYNSSGTAIDALYWTVGVNQSTKITTPDDDFNDRPCIPSSVGSCTTTGVTLLSANEIYIFNPILMNYVGISTPNPLAPTNLTFSRIPDGGVWQGQTIGTIDTNNCNNGVCDTNAVSSCDGTATVTPINGIGPFNYLWNTAAGNQITQTATGLCASDYSVIVTDTANGCQQTFNVTISNNPLNTPTINSVTATCSSDGSSIISNYDASNTYAFTPAGPIVDAAGVITGMIVGTSYLVIATNGSCISLASASFSNAAQIPTPAIPTITSVAASCSSAGSSTISNYNAPNTYTFTPAGPTVGAVGVISGMSAGTSYTVTATNSSCTSLASLSFSNALQLPTPIVPTITSVAANCSSAGSSTISNYDASNTYTFTPAGPIVGAGGVISVMTIGTSYTVTATNGGCTSSASSSFSNTAQLSTPAVPTITSVAASCLSAGSSTISNYDVSNTYTFTPAGPIVGAAGVISSMTIGTSYTVIAANGGCSSLASVNFSNSAQLPPLQGTISGTNNSTCSVSPICVPTGTNVVINEVMHWPSGGQGLIGTGREYIELYNPTCSPIDISCFIIGTRSAPDSNPTGPLQTGGSIIIPSGTILQPKSHYVIGTSSTSSNLLSVDFKTDLNLSNYCSTGNFVMPNGDGWLALYNSSGTAIDALYWTVGVNQSTKITTPDDDFNDRPCIPSSVGSCTTTGVTLLSANEIYIFNPILMNYVGISTPNPLAPTNLTFSRIPDGGVWQGQTIGTIDTNNCNNGVCDTNAVSSCDGTATVTPINGIGPFNYLWNTAAGNQITQTATGLCASDYSVIVTDTANGCQQTFNVTISNNPLNTPTINSVTATCSSDGSSIISNYDASNTYAFTPAGPIVDAAGVITGMIVGTSYLVIATNGSCISLASASFSNAAQIPTPAIPTITSVAASCSSAGSSTISNYNAPNTYAFTPAGPIVDAAGVITGMIVGTSYLVIATNGSCISLASASFSNAAQIPTPAIPTITSVAASCSSAGSSTISNYNAPNTYTFTPAGPTVGAVGVISGMSAGTSYTVTATNSSCTSLASLSFSNALQLPTPIVPTITSLAASCLSTGSSTISNYDVSNSYTFSPTGPSVGATGVISGMTVGTIYTVTATNSGCTSLSSVSFSNAAELESPIVSITHGCNGISYELSAIVELGVATYEWFNSSLVSLGSTPTISITNPDTYEVRVSLNGCSVIDFVTIDDAFCMIPKGISPNNDGDNDSWDLSNLNVEKAQIFNRYGVEVYSKNNYTDEWDGRTDSGEELPTATYYYVLTFSNGTVKTGWVYLNRVN